jgi:hypothetical protein
VADEKPTQFAQTTGDNSPAINIAVILQTLGRPWVIAATIALALIGGATLWSIEKAREEGRQQAAAALDNIQKLLTPLDEINITVDFKLTCDRGSFTDFCKAIVAKSLKFRESYNGDATTDNGAVEALGVKWTASPSKERMRDAHIQSGPIKPGDIDKVLRALGTITPTGIIIHSSSTWWSAWPTWEIGQIVILPIDIALYARGSASSSYIEYAKQPGLHGYLVGATSKSDTALEARYDFESQNLTVHMRGHLTDLTRDRTMVSTEDLHGATMVIFELNQNFFKDASVASFTLETKGGVKTVVDVARLTPGPKRQSESYEYVFP